VEGRGEGDEGGLGRRQGVMCIDRKRNEEAEGTGGGLSDREQRGEQYGERGGEVGMRREWWILRGGGMVRGWGDMECGVVADKV